MSNHSILPPSSAHIWGKPDGCTGWVLMAQQYPEDEDAEEAKEGTTAHGLGYQMIDSAARAGLNAPKREELIDTIDENGVAITEEMFDAAELYADHVAKVMRSSGIFGGFNMGLEERIEIPTVHELNWGTPDCWIYDHNKGLLHIWDFKFGYAPVEAFRNWQCLNYAAGIISKLGLNDEFLTVKIHIVQPRAFHRNGPVRTWEFIAANARGDFNILHTNAHKALSADAEYKTGEHCRYCTGRHACPAALEAGLRLYEVAVKADGSRELSPQALGLELSIIRRARQQLEYLESGFEAQVKNRIKSGQDIPGWITENAYGRLNWSRPIGEVIAMGEMFGIDLSKPSAITPTQAKNKGIDEAVITAYSARQKSGIKIVPDDGSKAKRIFNNG